MGRKRESRARALLQPPFRRTSEGDAEGAESGHIHLDHIHPSAGKGGIQCRRQRRCVRHPRVPRAEGAHQGGEVRVPQVGEAAPPAIGGVLDVADHAIAAVVHQQQQDVAAGLNGRGKFAAG